MISNIDTIKRDLDFFQSSFSGAISEHKLKYNLQYEPYLEEHYGTPKYPDNFAMGYSADIMQLEEDVYQLGFNFYLGDFNLGFGMNFCFPYERHLNEGDAKYMHERLVAAGLWMQREPVVVENVVKRLFPDFSRRKFIEKFTEEDVN